MRQKLLKRVGDREWGGEYAAAVEPSERERAKCCREDVQVWILLVVCIPSALACQQLGKHVSIYVSTERIGMSAARKACQHLCLYVYRAHWLGMHTERIGDVVTTTVTNFESLSLSTS